MANWQWIILTVIAFANADDFIEERKSKLPFIADAVGNPLPAPQNGPATVGSPVKLLTPDRYEFYTFDESGELVKRLMTLEEIQAIVAAGEGSDGHFVTFSNDDDQPPITFNYSQAPFTKVHSVVTNVQNVLKAQMEAQKNNPPIHPALDTPDVSDSWSLILPTIFGNTGADIVPDKLSSTHTMPDTETVEYDNSLLQYEENNLSKEGEGNILNTETTVKYDTSLLTTKETNKIVSNKITPYTSKTTLPPKITTTSKIPVKSSADVTTTVKPKTTTRLMENKNTFTVPSQTKTTTITQKIDPLNVHVTPKPSTHGKPSIPATKSSYATTKPPSSATKSSTEAMKWAAVTKPSYTTTKPTSDTTKPLSFSTTPSSIVMKPSTDIYKPASFATKSSTSAPRPFTKPQNYDYKVSTSQVTDPQSSIKPVQVIPSTSKPSTTSYSKENLTTTYNRIQSTTKYHSNFYSTSSKKNNTYAHSSTQAATNVTEALPSKVSTTSIESFVPVSTIAYLTTERSTTKIPYSTKNNVKVLSTTKRSTFSTNKTTTAKPKISTKAPIPVTTYKPIKSTKIPITTTLEYREKENSNNATTLTTQSVSPSTTISSTEYMSTEKKQQLSESFDNNLSDIPLPMFDVALSISQIATDLGNNYQIINSSSILNDKKVTDSSVESKESLEIDITNESKNNTNEFITSTTVMPLNDSDGFVKITTFEPHDFINQKEQTSKTTTKIEHKDKTPLPYGKDNEKTTIDPVLSESMDDLLSQVVNQMPETILASTQLPTTSTRKVEIKHRFKPESTTTKLSSTLESSTKKTPAEVIKIQTYKPSTEKIISKSTQTPFEKELNNTLSSVSLKYVTTTYKSNEIASKPSTEHLDIKQIITDLTTKTPISTEATVAKISKISTTQATNDVTSPKETFKTKISSEKILNSSTINSAKNESLIKNGDQIKNNSVNSQLSRIPTTTQKTVHQVSPDKIEPLSLFETKQVNDMQNYFATKNISENIDSTTVRIEDFKKKIQKVNIDDKELIINRNNTWKLVSTMTPPNESSKEKIKTENAYFIPQSDEGNKEIDLEVSKENQGLEVTTKGLGKDILQFTELCNELAFRYWNSLTMSIDKKRSFVLSPYSITSMLAMMFMGARGATSGEMNEILKLDDMVTFNPHFTLKNISDSIETTPEAGVATSAFVRELYSDRTKGKILTFYKERAQQFYSGHVEEVNFKLISDIIRRRTNLLVKRQTWGKMLEYMKANSIILNPPLAAFSVNIFQTDCTGSSVEGRDGEMYFVVSPTVRQRRLVPVPSVVYKKGFLAGYDPVLDATAAALGSTSSIVSTLFIMPGQQGNIVNAEDLESLEKRLLDSNPTIPVWNRLLRTLLPRIGLELQIPRFSHKSVFNVSSSLKTMGLNDLFDSSHADLGGLTGPSKELYLSDMVQHTTFVTCGEGVVGEQHHIEEYPETLEVVRRRRTSRWNPGWDEPRDYQRAFHDPNDAGDAMHLPLHLRPRQARLPAREAQPARLKFDRPFLFFVRHNPTGMILYFGRYNPRLLP